MHGEHLIGRQCSGIEFGTIAGRPFDNFDISQITGIYGDGSGGIVNQRGMIGINLPTSGRGGGEGGGNTLQRIQGADAAAEAPGYANILDVIIIRIKTGGKHGELVLRPGYVKIL